jgi:hypothetical protein
MCSVIIDSLGYSPVMVMENGNDAWRIATAL